jgi:type VI protein secretion system component VasA
MSSVCWKDSVSWRRGCSSRSMPNFPRFTQHLLEIFYPHYLAPTPSMLIARFAVGSHRGGPRAGFCHSQSHRIARRAGQRRAELPANIARRTTKSRLWPLEITEARIFCGQGAAWPCSDRARYAHRIRAGVRLRLRTTLPRSGFEQAAAGPVDPVSAAGAMPCPCVCTSNCTANAVVVAYCHRGNGRRPGMRMTSRSSRSERIGFDGRTGVATVFAAFVPRLSPAARILCFPAALSVRGAKRPEQGGCAGAAGEGLEILIVY